MSRLGRKAPETAALAAGQHGAGRKTEREPTAPRRTLAAVAAAAAVLALTSCASSTTARSSDAASTAPAPAGSPTPTSLPTVAPYPTGASGSPRAPLPNPSKVNGSSPDAVAEAALTVMFSEDTRIDTSPRDATVRAAPYLTPVYAADLADHQAAAAPGAQWNTWAAHNAYTTASVTPAPDSGAPADTTTSAFRTYTVTATAHGTDGYTDVEAVGTAFVELVRNGAADPWRVSDVEIR